MAGNSALYWTELTLTAPAEAGMFVWSVVFAAPNLALAHHGSSSRFSIAIVAPPEHGLTVKVVEQGTATPVENAPTAIAVNADLAVDVAIRPVREENPDDLWQM